MEIFDLFWKPISELNFLFLFLFCTVKSYLGLSWNGREATKGTVEEERRDGDAVRREWGERHRERRMKRRKNKK